MSDAVRVERRGPVTIVLLSRPERRNAVDGATARALADAFRAFDADSEASVAVLHGEGGVFCAGADLKAIGTPESNRVSADGDGSMGPTRMRLSKPVIAAIAGHAVAGGLELALWCDLRVAEEDAIMGVFCRRWGVPLIDGGTVRLPRLIGESRAMDLILTGRPGGAGDRTRQPRGGQGGESRGRRAACGRAGALSAAMLARGPPVGARAIGVAGAGSDRQRAYPRPALAVGGSGGPGTVSRRGGPARRIRRDQLR